jgi:WXG100 family type VII secretion target
MSEPFAVDVAVLQDVIDRMARFERSLQQQLAEVDDRVSQLQQVWSGQAAQEQAEAHQRWLTGAQAMHAAVTALRRIAATAHGNYTGAVVANRQMWG